MAQYRLGDINTGRPRQFLGVLCSSDSLLSPTFHGLPVECAGCVRHALLAHRSATEVGDQPQRRGHAQQLGGSVPCAHISDVYLSSGRVVDAGRIHAGPDRLCAASSQIQNFMYLPQGGAAVGGRRRCRLLIQLPDLLPLLYQPIRLRQRNLHVLQLQTRLRLSLRLLLAGHGSLLNHPLHHHHHLQRSHRLQPHEDEARPEAVARFRFGEEEATGYDGSPDDGEPGVPVLYPPVRPVFRAVLLHRVPE